jgi:hypothetical protein
MTELELDERGQIPGQLELEPLAGTVYLLHFDRPYRHARHYLGWTADETVDARLARHRAGGGARLIAVIRGGRDRVRARADVAGRSHGRAAAKAVEVLAAAMPDLSTGPANMTPMGLSATSPTGLKILEALEDGGLCERDLFIRLRPVDRLALHRLLADMESEGALRQYHEGRYPGAVVTMYRRANA